MDGRNLLKTVSSFALLTMLSCSPIVKENTDQPNIMEVEKKTGKCIPDEALNVKPYHELTVGELMGMLYDYLKDK